MIVVREMCLSRLRIQLPIDHHWLSREEAFGRENILSSWIRQSLCLFCIGEFGKEKKKAKNGPHVRVEHLPFVAVNWWEKRSSFSLEGKEQNVPQAQLASSHSKTFKSYLSRSVIWGFEENFLSDQNSAFRKLWGRDELSLWDRTITTYKSDHFGSCYWSLISQMTTLHTKRHDEEKNEVQLGYTEGH